jgi:hypothetical protein
MTGGLFTRAGQHREGDRQSTKGCDPPLYSGASYAIGKIHETPPSECDATTTASTSLTAYHYGLVPSHFGPTSAPALADEYQLRRMGAVPTVFFRATTNIPTRNQKTSFEGSASEVYLAVLSRIGSHRNRFEGLASSAG